jgi:hypothetical protein
MKNLKLVFLSILFVVCCFTSCTNDEPLIEEQNTEESQSITTSLAQLRTQFNSQGDVNPTNNPAGNIVFDFCFDFVYPLNLSYNNGATVTVNSLGGLIDIMINSTNDLYISGVEFPFDVEVYNDDTDAIEIVTINNEDEFFDLLVDCDFDSIDECECEDEVDPVCVEVQDPTGESFIITYPNECLAFCDGFTENDFAENCEDDYNCPGGNECFEFVYPITIITDDNQTITINSQEELDSALYNAYYFDFVYPFEVTTEEGDIEVIEDVEDFEDLLEDCFYDGNDDDCECEDEEFDPVCIEVENPNGVIEIFTFPNECIAECEGFDSEDFIDCGNTGPIECSIEDITNTLADYCWSIDFVDFNEFIYNLNSDGTYEMQDVGGNSGGSLLTSGTWSVVAANDTFYITLNAEVAVYNDEWVVIQCNESNESLEMQSLVYPQADIYSINCNGGDGGDYDCSSEDGISNILTECPWIIDFIDFNEFIYTFNIDGTYEVQSDNNILTTGTWDLIAANNDYIINLNAELSEYNDVWLIGDCDEEMGLTIGSIDYPQAEIYSVNCD